MHLLRILYTRTIYTGTGLQSSLGLTRIPH